MHKNPLTTWPPNERPREKLHQYGAKNLSDAELLAILLRTGISGKTVLDLAREFLNEFGSLKQALDAKQSKTRGLGHTKLTTLKAAVELGRRYFEEPIPLGEKLNNSQATKLCLASRLKNYAHEVFACLFLDNQHRVICFEELFHGTLTETHIYPREIVKRALAHNAAKIILAHNHPSGNATPSQADKEVTQLLKNALALVEIQLVDHIVIGGKENTSFAEIGLL